jgi:hypothetical protein
MEGFQQSARTFNADNRALAALMLRLDDPIDVSVHPLVTVMLKMLG